MTMFMTKTSRNNFARYAFLCIGMLAVDSEYSARANTNSIESGYASFYAGLDKSPLNRHTKTFVKNYIRRNQESLHQIKQRSSMPFNMIDSVFAGFRLPLQLKYMAVVESELKATAVSRVGAAGPWQLMPETAHILGLKVTRRNDERKNYYKSTRAAARYLRDLHANFGDWLLVLAAYNGGEGPVNYAIHESGSRSFWAMQPWLPAETRDYVKKFIATCYYFEGATGLAKLSAANVFQEAKTASIPSPRQASASQKMSILPGRESSDEKFQRLMRESESSLKQSDQILKTGR